MQQFFGDCADGSKYCKYNLGLLLLNQSTYSMSYHSDDGREQDFQLISKQEIGTSIEPYSTFPQTSATFVFPRNNNQNTTQFHCACNTKDIPARLRSIYVR